MRRNYSKLLCFIIGGALGIIAGIILLETKIIPKSSFWESFFSNFLADLLVGILIAYYIERRLKYKEKHEQQKLVINMIWSELRYNKELLENFIENIPNGNLVFPPLETSIWESINRQAFIDFFKPTLIAEILGVYAQTNAINKMYQYLLDRIDWVEGKILVDINREKFLNPFIIRCKKLLKLINEVLDFQTANPNKNRSGDF